MALIGAPLQTYPEDVSEPETRKPKLYGSFADSYEGSFK